MKVGIFILSLLLVSGVIAGKSIFLSGAKEDTVMGISHSLACPCECPMVLEDCHMSCGLSWKKLIGERLKAGEEKESIVSYFYKRYGKEAMLTPIQRIAGKWYQVTRGGYQLKEMVLLVLITGVWTMLVYFMLITVVEMKGKKQ